MFLAPVIASPLAGLKEPPSRLLIAKWGRNESIKGAFTVGQKTKRLLPAVQAALGFDNVQLDFEHNTVPGTEAFKASTEPRNIAADAARLAVVEGEGIYAEGIRWTPHGVKSVTEGLHPDLSPTIKTDDAGEVVFIHSAALCRQGCVPDLKVFSAADLLTAAQLKAFSATVNQPATPAPMDYKKLLLMILGLSETATDSDIETAANKLKGTAATPTDVQANAAAIKDVTTNLQKIADRLDAAERKNLLSEAVMAGKLIPQGINKLGNDELKELLDSLEANVVPLSQRTPEKLKTFSVSSLATAPTAMDETVRKGLGLSKDDWEKFGKVA